MRTFCGALILLSCFMLAGCSPPLPDTLGDYAVECILMTPEPIPPTEDDPHVGFKDVYACGISEEDLLAQMSDGAPWPDGSMVLKESTKAHQGYPWLIATASKQAGSWEWAEYTRNFESEDFAQIPVGEDTCIDCHKKVKSSDYIYTHYITSNP